jgi:hypothetical protein
LNFKEAEPSFQEMFMVGSLIFHSYRRMPMNRVKKPITLLIASFTILIVAASCATKPKEPAPEPAPEPAAPAQIQVEPPKAPEISQADLDALLADAKALKKKAFDLKLYEVLADDYKAADARLAAGKQAYDDEKAEEAKEGLEAAKADFASLIERGLVELVAIGKRDAEDMKSLALRADAGERTPDRIEAGDGGYAEAEGLVGEGKSEAALPAYETARLYYELAYKRAIAGSLKDEIEEKDFAKWDSGNFQTASNKYEAEEGLWASGSEDDRAQGVDALDEAILRFNLVIQKGKETVAVNTKGDAESSKARSDDIKAYVSAKDEYESAEAAMRDADSQFTRKEYEGAATGYEDALGAYERAYDLAAEKRAKAEEAMRTAGEAAEESQRKAEEADPIVNGTKP